MSVVTKITVVDLRDVMSRLGLVTRPGIVRVGSGPDLRSPGEGLALSPSMLILRTIRDQHVLRGSLQLSDLLPLIIIITWGLRSTTGPCPSNIIIDDMRMEIKTRQGRLMFPDEMWSWLLPYLNRLRRLSQSSSRQLGQQQRTTRQVWRPGRLGNAFRLGTGCRLGRRSGLGRCWRAGSGGRLGRWCRPDGRWGLVRCCWPGRSWGLDSCRLGAVGGSAGSGTPAGTTPARVSDARSARTGFSDVVWGWYCDFSVTA